MTEKTQGAKVYEGKVAGEHQGVRDAHGQMRAALRPIRVNPEEVLAYCQKMAAAGDEIAATKGRLEQWPSPGTAWKFVSEITSITNQLDAARSTLAAEIDRTAELMARYLQIESRFRSPGVPANVLDELFAATDTEPGVVEQQVRRGQLVDSIVTIGKSFRTLGALQHLQTALSLRAVNAVLGTRARRPDKVAAIRRLVPGLKRPEALALVKRANHLQRAAARRAGGSGGRASRTPLFGSMDEVVEATRVSGRPVLATTAGLFDNERVAGRARVTLTDLSRLIDEVNGPTTAGRAASRAMARQLSRIPSLTISGSQVSRAVSGTARTVFFVFDVRTLADSKASKLDRTAAGFGVAGTGAEVVAKRILVDGAVKRGGIIVVRNLALEGAAVSAASVVGEGAAVVLTVTAGVLTVASFGKDVYDGYIDAKHAAEIEKAYSKAYVTAYEKAWARDGAVISDELYTRAVWKATHPSNPKATKPIDAPCGPNVVTVKAEAL